MEAERPQRDSPLDRKFYAQAARTSVSGHQVVAASRSSLSDESHSCSRESKRRRRSKLKKTETSRSRKRSKARINVLPEASECWEERRSRGMGIGCVHQPLSRRATLCHSACSFSKRMRK